MKKLLALLLLAVTFSADAAIVPAVGWTPCAAEGATCTFTGTRRVFYGVVGKPHFTSKPSTTSATCTAAFFGRDPAVGQTKSCWYSSVVVGLPSPTGSIPTIASVAARVDMTTDTDGIVVTANGQVIENVRVSNPNGPCITIRSYSNVIIRDSEVGPCGLTSGSQEHSGIDIQHDGSTGRPPPSNISMQRNSIHDAPTLIRISGAVHPILIDRNLLYNVRGGQWQFQALQFNGSTTATGQSKITCNVMDDQLVSQSAMAGGGTRKVEDHVSFYATTGTPTYPIEFAYNRIRGGTDGRGGISGSGTQMGDGGCGGGNPCSGTPAGYYYLHHNFVYRTNGQGLAIAGGEGSVLTDNIVDNRGSNQATNTGWAYGVRNFDGSIACSINYQRNRGVAFLWAFNQTGELAPNEPVGASYPPGQPCSITYGTGANANNFQETSMPDYWGNYPTALPGVVGAINFTAQCGS